MPLWTFPDFCHFVFLNCILELGEIDAQEEVKLGRELNATLFIGLKTPLGGGDLGCVDKKPHPMRLCFCLDGSDVAANGS